MTAVSSVQLWALNLMQPWGLFPGARVREPCGQSLFAWCKQKVSLTGQSGLCFQNCWCEYFLLRPVVVMLWMYFFKWCFFLPPSHCYHRRHLFLSSFGVAVGLVFWVVFISKLPSPLPCFCSAFVVYDGHFICFSKCLHGALVSCITLQGLLIFNLYLSRDEGLE